MYSGKILMSDAFNKAFSIAYGNEYNMPNIVIFSNSRFRWCKKLSFSHLISPILKSRRRFANHIQSQGLASTIYVQNGRLQVQSSVLTISMFTGMKESAAYLSRPCPSTANNTQQKIPFSVLDTSV